MPENPLQKPKQILWFEKLLKVKILNKAFADETASNLYVQDSSDEIIEIQLNNIDNKYLPNFSGFNSLRKLTITQSGFSDVKSLIKLSDQLESLSLAGNYNLDNIWELRFLHKLKFLDISYTKIWDLSPLAELLKNENFVLEFDRQQILFPPLYRLKISSVKTISAWFENKWNRARQLIEENFETKQTTLDLGFCAITDLSIFPKLFECGHLEILILSNEWASYIDGQWERIVSKNEANGFPNNIIHVPNKLQRLSKLKQIYFGGDWKTDEGRWNRWRITNFGIFTKLANLEYVNVSNNAINHIYGLGNLQKLRTLHANNNCISEITIADTLRYLQELFLSNNQLQDVSFLNFCPEIQTIDLHSNRLRDLQNVRTLIERLDIQDTKWALNTISVAQNKTLLLPPLDVITSGRSSVMDYFNRWEKEQELDLPLFNNTNVKIMLVGNSGVGKTTLAEWLATNVINLNQKSTHWLNRLPWNETVNGKVYNLRIFDFGGQEYYHDTHHLFFTQDTIYVLLWDQAPYDLFRPNTDNAESDIIAYPIEYWLDSIDYFINRRKLARDEKQIRDLIVAKDKSNAIEKEKDQPAVENQQNKDSQRHTLVLQSKVDNYRNIQFLDQRMLHKKYNWIADFGNFSVLEQRSLQHVKDQIFELLDNLPLIDRPLLGTWGAIKNKIEKTSNRRKNELTITKFRNYCNKIISQLPELETASKQRIKRLQFDRLNTLSFIRYLSSIGLVLYFPDNKALSDKVFINQNHLIKHIHYILNLIADKKGIIQKSGIFLSLPSDLKKQEAQTIITLMIHFKIVFQHPGKSETLIAPLYLPAKPLKAIQIFLSQFKKPIFRYQFKGFIHRYVILEFFSSFGSKVLKGTSDLDPYYFWKNGVVLKDDLTEEIVLIRFENSNEAKDYKGFIDVYSLTGKRDGFMNEVLKELDNIILDRNVEKSVCAPDGAFIPIRELNFAAEKEHYIFKYGSNYYKLVDFKEFLDRPPLMKNLFISYSKDDLTTVNVFKKHLSALQRDGKVGHWYCTELIAGEDWNESIQRHFQESDIICFMVSPNFMQTDYIFDYEIKKAFERKGHEPGFKIVPIILEFCRWTTEKYNLGQYTALPYTAKPVSDFKNQHMAWYIIEEALRLMIDDENAPSGESFYKSERLPKDVREIYERITRKEVS
jgi:hypothetical protein